jgi:hypothetical protein
MFHVTVVREISPALPHPRIKQLSTLKQLMAVNNAEITGHPYNLVKWPTIPLTL